MMSEPLTQSKGHLAFDMGWRTAAVGAFFFGFCLLATGAGAWKIVTGAPVGLRITWQTVFVLLASVWYVFKIQDRTARFALGLLAISSGSRIMFAVAKASVQTQILNAQIMRVANLMVMAGFCGYIAYWFKQQIKRV
jgi:hypothetical protein